MTAHDEGIRVIHRDYQSSSRFSNRSQCRKETAIVVHVIENKTAHYQVKVGCIVWLWLTEIRHLIRDLPFRVFGTGNLNQVCRNIYSCHVRAKTSKDTGNIALTTTSI